MSSYSWLHERSLSLKVVLETSEEVVRTERIIQSLIIEQVSLEDDAFRNLKPMRLLLEETHICMNVCVHTMYACMYALKYNG